MLSESLPLCLLPKSTYLLGIGQKEKTKQNLGLTFKFGEFIADNTRELIVVSFCLQERIFYCNEHVEEI
jgi:hypothetical protein